MHLYVLGESLKLRTTACSREISQSLCHLPDMGLGKAWLSLGLEAQFEFSVRTLNVLSHKLRTEL